MQCNAENDSYSVRTGDAMEKLSLAADVYVCVHACRERDILVYVCTVAPTYVQQYSTPELWFGDSGNARGTVSKGAKGMRGRCGDVMVRSWVRGLGWAGLGWAMMVVGWTVGVWMGLGWGVRGLRNQSDHTLVLLGM